MEFIDKESIEQIKNHHYKRARDDYFINYSPFDLFNGTKEILLASNISKPTWYLLIDRIKKQSISSDQPFISTTMPLNLIQMAYEIFRDTGELISMEDIRNILYTYEDWCPHHLELAIKQHFSIQWFAQELYKLKVNRALAEILCLSDFIILKMCPDILMKAQISTFHIAIKYAKQDEDYETIVSIADYGLSILAPESETYKYCSNARKRYGKKIEE